eukprot:1186608-Prorocentrum_minimum.AAC.7
MTRNACATGLTAFRLSEIKSVPITAPRTPGEAKVHVETVECVLASAPRHPSQSTTDGPYTAGGQGQSESGYADGTVAEDWAHAERLTLSIVTTHLLICACIVAEAARSGSWVASICATPSARQPHLNGQQPRDQIRGDGTPHLAAGTKTIRSHPSVITHARNNHRQRRALETWSRHCRIDRYTSVRGGGRDSALRVAPHVLVRRRVAA